MPVQPLTPAGVVERVVAAVLALGSGTVRVAVDGHPGARPGELADALVDPLRAAGRPVARVHARDFLRPASVRLQHGHHDPDAYYEDWLDARGLAREVLDPLAPDLAPDGPASTRTGRYLPSLWDAERDRATRAPYVQAAPGTVLVLDGSLLLGRWLDLDLTVHLAQRPATRARLTPAPDAWQLAAYERYDAEVEPESVADLVVRVDDPRRPALVEPG